MLVLKVKVISLPYIFQVLYVLCFTNVKISGERLQDQWSSGFSLTKKTLISKSTSLFFGYFFENPKKCVGEGFGISVLIFTLRWFQAKVWPQYRKHIQIQGGQIVFHEDTLH